MSDHGHTRTGYGQTDEGKRELYHPLLFMVVPYYVTGLLGEQRMEALVSNQNRLLTTIDLHRFVEKLFLTAQLKIRPVPCNCSHKQPSAYGQMLKPLTNLTITRF